MSWLDRLIGVVFGTVVGAAAFLLMIALSTLVDDAARANLIGAGNALFLGFAIWGWYGGAYVCGRFVAWLRK